MYSRYGNLYIGPATCLLTCCRRVGDGSIDGVCGGQRGGGRPHHRRHRAEPLQHGRDPLQVVHHHVVTHPVHPHDLHRQRTHGRWLGFRN